MTTLGELCCRRWPVALFVLPTACVRPVSTSDLVAEIPNESTTRADDEPNGKGGVYGPRAHRLELRCEPEPAPAAPSVMVEIQGGAFWMGCNAAVDADCNDDETPQHQVDLSTFAMDATEVSQLQYYACVQAGACRSPTCDWQPCAERGSNPVVCINFDDAERYCGWQDKRLPSEAEWEKAARGTTGLLYPWGNEPIDCTKANMVGCRANDGVDGTLSVGALANASPYGAFDMAGNVVEWVKDYYDARYYGTSPPSNPAGPAKAGRHVGRGGGFRSEAVWHRAGQRDDYEPEYFRDSMGVRCAR